MAAVLFIYRIKMAILLNRIINQPVIFEIKWDPFFNGEYWIDKENALKFKDRIEVIHEDLLRDVTTLNVNSLFEDNNTFLKLGGIVLHSKILKVSQGKECKIKYGENFILSEGLVDQGIYLKCDNISESEIELKVIKRWKEKNTQNDNLTFNLSSLRVELDNDPISSKKIILNFSGRELNNNLNSIAIKNMQNELEISNIENQLILKSELDSDGEEFTVQMNDIITTSYTNL
jgi:hypothetical protein